MPPRRDANARSAKDTYELGVRLYRGNGVTKDIGEAARLLRLAADQGLADAQVYFGMMSEDHGEKTRYYRLAAEQGHAGGQDLLGTRYYEGDGVLQDYGEAVQWFRLSAEQGYAAAQGSLGECYHLARGVPRDYGESVRWYRPAADQDFAPAQTMLGRMLVGDLPVDERVPADPRAGAKLLARAAQNTQPGFERFPPQALEALRRHADKREVVWACCIGCGATHGLKRCVKCHAARFCGSACMRQMWPIHKRCCAQWAEQRDDAPQ
jgi:TPR repeat protein